MTARQLGQVLASTEFVGAAFLSSLFILVGLGIASGHSIPRLEELRKITGTIERSAHVRYRRPDLSGYHRIALRTDEGGAADFTIAESLLDDKQVASLQGRAVTVGVFGVRSAGIPHYEGFLLIDSGRTIVSYEAATLAKAQFNRNGLLVGLGFVAAVCVVGLRAWHRSRRSDA